ncbi:MAG: NUDIX domain-containing protein [Lachnospiraceae bacterium]|nr:NUDIX domain-containing protein [Lachnospiraceae bacterium]
MELWDLYDREGNKTGEIWERSFGSFHTIPEGRYHLVCDILVQHTDGTFLLTKRHSGKDVYPGYWEASAGGSAIAGENPEEAAKRELFEETGIKADKLEFIGINFRDKSHGVYYSYLVVTDCPKDSIVLQEGETTEYKWVDKKGLIEYVDSDLAIKTHNDRYKELFDKYRKEI